jgi:ABC-type polar amino acid transport system ATPase subunit
MAFRTGKNHITEILGLLEKPSSGEFSKRQIPSLSNETDPVRRRIGMVFQNPVL